MWKIRVVKGTVRAREYDNKGNGSKGQESVTIRVMWSIR